MPLIVATDTGATDHVTLCWTVDGETVAVNCCNWPTASCMLAGVTDTDCATGVGFDRNGIESHAGQPAAAAQTQMRRLASTHRGIDRTHLQ